MLCSHVTEDKSFEFTQNSNSKVRYFSIFSRPAALSVVATLFGDYLCNMIWGPATSFIMVKVTAASLIGIVLFFSLQIFYR